MTHTPTRLTFIVLSLLSLTACVSSRQWSTTGGSRSEGVVRLSYEYEPSQEPEVSEAQATQLALSRCQTWGYSDAEAFGGQWRTCSDKSGGSCELWTVTREYQCTGQPSTAAR